MIKNLKKKIQSVKNKFLWTTISLTSFAFATSTGGAASGNGKLLGQVMKGGGVNNGSGLIKQIINGNTFIKVTLQAIIIGIIIYALFNIAKEFVSGQGGGGGGIWKNLGAILFASLMYYFLFIQIAGG